PVPHLFPDTPRFRSNALALQSGGLSLKMADIQRHLAEVQFRARQQTQDSAIAEEDIPRLHHALATRRVAAHLPVPFDDHRSFLRAREHTSELPAREK